MAIEIHQGDDEQGRAFGYDRERKNFITWGMVHGVISVVKVENDCEETDHGSLIATLVDAQAICRRENGKPNSQLRRAICCAAGL